MAITSTLREMKSSTIACWLAKSVCVAGERLTISTSKPAALASSAARSK